MSRPMTLEECAKALAQMFEEQPETRTAAALEQILATWREVGREEALSDPNVTTR